MNTQNNNNAQTLTNRPTEGFRKSPLEAFEAKILNAETSVETNTKLAAELEEQAKKAREAAEASFKAAETMKAKKEVIINVAELLKELGNEATIAIEMAELEEELAPTPAPAPEPQEKSEPEPEAVSEPGKDSKAPAPAPEPQEKSEPEPDAVSEPGKDSNPEPEPVSEKSETTDIKQSFLDEAIAEIVEQVLPEASVEASVEKKSEAEPQSEQSLISYDVDGYNFKFDKKTIDKTFTKFDFSTPKNQNFSGAAVLKIDNRISVGLQLSGEKAMTYTSNTKFPGEWDTHLFAIEKAFQEVKQKTDIQVEFPHRAIEVPQADYNQEGLIVLNMEKAELVKKFNGYTVSFQNSKNYKLTKHNYRGITLKVLGEGTTISGKEVHCSFPINSSEYFVTCKNSAGKQFKDSTAAKRNAMPREFAAIRKAAIAWMEKNFPQTSSKWESQVTYVVGSPKPTDTQPANAAAAPSK